MLHLNGVEYAYEQGFHLGPVELSAEAGSFTVFLGPNGSGKSTLFSLINGIRKPVRGRLLLDGTDLGTLDERKRARRIGMVSQVSRIQFDYTVEELVAMGRFPYRRLFSGESRADRAVVERVLERLDLGPYRKRYVQSLSGGEYQRVLIARALAQETEVILLDEPGNHLDLKHQMLLLGILREEASNGKTVVAVLHDINQALHYADTALLLNRGRAVAAGTPAAVLTAEKIREVFDTEVGEYRNSSGRIMLGPA